MAEEAIRGITAAEARGKENVSEAGRQAAEILRRAKAEADGILSNSARNSLERGNKILAEARARSYLNAQPLEADALARAAAYKDPDKATEERAVLAVRQAIISAKADERETRERK